jgi:hypothetical protein
MFVDDTDIQRKLGLKPGMRSYTLHAPGGYDRLLSLPSALSNSDQLRDNADWVQAFYLTKSQLDKEIGQLKSCIRKDGQLWICWPKNAADLSDKAVRSAGLGAGLVDVKVASINSDWSGLKFVYRLAYR